MAVTYFELHVRITAPRLKGLDATDWCEAHGITPSTDVRFMPENDTILYVEESVAELFSDLFQSSNRVTITLPLDEVLDSELYVEENEADEGLLIGYKIPNSRAQALLTAYESS